VGSRKVTLEESISTLAQATGASSAFVDKVRALFLVRGVDLEDSSEPYTGALKEAFRRHAEIREHLDDARRSLARLNANIVAMGDSFSGQLARLRAAREALERRRPRRHAAAPIDVDKLRLVRGEHDRSVVPGPEEMQ
jgi:hypothetical protein